MLVAIDTGGTKTLIAVFSDSREIKSQEKFPTPHDIDDYVDFISNKIKDLNNANDIKAISIALPGEIENDIIINCPNLNWKNVNLVSLLKNHIKEIPIYIENDANLGAIGEHYLRKLKKESLLFVAIGTGIGTGMIAKNNSDNYLLKNCEGGHMVLNKNGEYLEWEKFASGRAILEKYQKYAKDIKDQDIWNNIALDIGEGLIVLIPILNPDILAIGGSIGVFFDNYGNMIKQFVDDNLSPSINRPKIMKSLQPESAILYGCYYNAQFRKIS